MADIIEILTKAVGAGASDIHLVIGKPPMMRLNGDIMPIPGFEPLNKEASKALIYSVLFEHQRMAISG